MGLRKRIVTEGSEGSVVLASVIGSTLKGSHSCAYCCAYPINLYVHLVSSSTRL